MPFPREIWHWQEAGTAWKGVGIYHVTLTIPSRQPLLGTLPRIPFGKIIEKKHKTQNVDHPAVIWQKNIISLQRNFKHD
jgi:hypothetical protein